MRYQRHFNARAFARVTTTGRHALGVSRTVIFRGGGGQFGVADAHRRGIDFTGGFARARRRITKSNVASGSPPQSLVVTVSMMLSPADLRGVDDSSDDRRRALPGRPAGAISTAENF